MLISKLLSVLFLYLRALIGLHISLIECKEHILVCSSLLSTLRQFFGFFALSRVIEHAGLHRRLDIGLIHLELCRHKILVYLLESLKKEACVLKQIVA
jgi:hypothetical protein